MHTHIILNHDNGLHLVIRSEEEDVDLVSVLNQIIVNQLCHA
jgi:hypothetical protein